MTKHKFHFKNWFDITIEAKTKEEAEKVLKQFVKRV